jgi:hypothetical protein
MFSQRLERNARAAEEKAERSRHRKLLKETKRKRDRVRTIHKRRVAAEVRISETIWTVAKVIASRVTGPAHSAAFDEAYFSTMDAVVAAAENAAAKSAGFETWADFEATFENEAETE